MGLLPVKCSFCSKVYYRESSRITEAKKFKWKQYCSIKCQSEAKNKQIKLVCSRPGCGNAFARQLNDLKDLSVIIARKDVQRSLIIQKYIKRPAVMKICGYCKKKF